MQWISKRVEIIQVGELCQFARQRFELVAEKHQVPQRLNVAQLRRDPLHTALLHIDTTQLGQVTNFARQRRPIDPRRQQVSQRRQQSDLRGLRAICERNSRAQARCQVPMCQCCDEGR